MKKLFKTFCMLAVALLVGVALGFLFVFTLGLIV